MTDDDSRSFGGRVEEFVLSASDPQVESPQLESLSRCRELLAGIVAGFEPRCWSSSDAVTLVGVFAEIERLAAAGKLFAAGQVERTNGWRSGGHRNAEEWLAGQTGTSLSAASEVLATAARVEQLPDTEAALRSGALSTEQAAAVSSGGAADPSAESRLLHDAGKGSLASLRRQAQAVRAAARGARAAEDRERIHRSRYFRHWTTSDGAFEGRFRLTSDQGAIVLAGVSAQRAQVFRDARTQGVRDESDAYEADALVAMAAASTSGSGGNVGATVNIRVDHAALVRGFSEPGEVCEITGVGPVPAATAQKATCDATINLVLVDGDQVIDVRPLGRTVPVKLRVALEERDRGCVVPGCDRSHGLEIHHLVPYSLGGRTSLDNLARLCGFHHDQISYHGARLTGPHPFWEWEPPPSPDEPTTGLFQAPTEPP